MAKDLKTIIPSIVKTVSVSSVAKVMTPIATAVVGGIPTSIFQTGMKQVANFGVNTINNIKIEKHNQTLRNWLGLRVKEYSVGTYECVAWVKTYVKETHGITLGSFGGRAKYAWSNKNIFKGWTFVPLNASGIFPPTGSIVVFEGSGYHREYGHIAVVDTGTDARVLNIVDQNSVGHGNGINGDEIRRRTVTYDGVLGWIIAPGWENVYGHTTNIAYNTQADGVTPSTQQGILANIYANDPQLQKLLNFFEQITGITSGAGVNKTPFKPRTEFEKWMFIDSNKTETEEKTEETKQNIKDNLNGIMIATMLEILKRMLGLPTLQGQLNGTNPNVSDPSSIPPSDTGNTPTLTTSGRIFLGDSEYAKKLNKLANVGDIRKKDIKGKNEFSLKSNNPTGMKYGKTTYNAMVANGATPTDINGRVPSNENGTYIAFKDMSDGIAGWRAFWGVYIGWAKNNKFTPPHLPDVKSALQIWGTGTLKTNPSFGVDKNLLELTDDDFAELCYRQLEKESPALFKYMNTL